MINYATIPLNEVIKVLNTDITEFKFYWGAPTEEKNETYCIVSVITEIDDTPYTTQTRVEFRVIAGDNTFSFKKLQTLESKIKNTLLKSLIFWQATFINIIQGQGSTVWLSDKDRKQTIRDFLFYFYNNETNE